MTIPGAPVPLRFGRFELQRHECRLLLDGVPVALGGRAFDLLRVLAERPGQLVGKPALMDLVWPGLVVQENNLAAQVSTLRKLLGEDVIATVPGRGYRFVAHLDPAPGSPPPLPPAAAAPQPLRTNLPAELPALLGRADETEALGALVDRHRVVSVVGAGGIGKSLLVQHLLQRRRNAYPQGVCWVELGAVADAAALPGVIATALGADARPGEPLAALVAALAPLSLLLALDNAEHLLEAVAQVAKALNDAAPGLRIVVTSQAPLKLGAEHVLRIGPLAVPDAALPAPQALAFGAVALFVERAQALGMRFVLGDAETRAVVEVCRALDGVPLAIELAAARVRALGVATLLGSMRDRFRLLSASRDRAAPGRQQTLHAALEWSHGLLSAREQRVFRRLGVLSGSSPLGLVEAVAADAAEGGEAPDRWAVLDALDALVDRSLVVVSAPHAERPPRYRLLESTRAFALEKLDAAAERAPSQRRHAHAVASLFDAAYDEYFAGRVGVDDWLHERESDFDNARDALRWARAEGEAEVELRIAALLLRALPPSLHAERMALADTCEARNADTLPEPLRLRVWIELSCVLADPQKARGQRAAAQALALARRLHPSRCDRFTLYHALCRAASAAAQAEDLGAAQALLDELQALEDPAWPAQRLLWGAEAAQWIARMAGDSATALRRGRRLLTLDRERGSHASIAIGNLVDAELRAGDAEAAARSGVQLVEALSGSRHEYSLAFARINLLAALLALGDRTRARPVAQAAWAQAVVFELQHAAAAYLALLAALDGRPRAAARLAGYSEALYAARDEAREGNETAATQRARSIAGDALGEPLVARLLAEGAALADAEIAALAFGTDDA